jgi:hypothetical protein
VRRDREYRGAKPPDTLADYDEARHPVPQQHAVPRLVRDLELAYDMPKAAAEK